AFRGLGSPAARRALTRAVAELLARVHEAGVYPSDLNDTNVLVAADGSPVLVDAEGLRFVGRVSERRRVRNVERLLRAFLGPNRVSRATRLRFLRAYASDRAATRALWRRVAERFAEKQATYGLADP
ncbi:hypothetical protein L6R52_35865, partial [Myxococcota bacterium]|nr:hypothetical protein [Myxococcota bacterium]